MYFIDIIKRSFISKLFQYVLVVLIGSWILMPVAVLIQTNNSNITLNQVKAYEFSSDLLKYAKKYDLPGTPYNNDSETAASLPVIIGSIIKSALAFLGVTFLLIIIIAGIRIMWSGGSEETVTKAKDSISRAVIGAIITLGAYAITYYIFTVLEL